MDALHRSLESSKHVASAAVIVDAKDDSAVSFYKKYGFLELPEIERRLFLPMGTIEQLFARGERRPPLHQLTDYREWRSKQS